jgi:GNAT superfamily N-acetyltransferase
VTQTQPAAEARSTSEARGGRLAAARALAAVLDSAAAGRFPAADGSVMVLPQPSERDAGVIGLTGYAVVFADADPGCISALLPEDDLSAPLSAAFLQALGQRLGLRSHSVDMLTCADPLPGGVPAGLDLTEIETAELATAERVHPRLARALDYRDEVRAWRTAGGLLTLGRGVAGRWEISVEVDPDGRGRGLGAALATAGRHLVPSGAPLWAQIAPANAASVRAFLRAGFRPVGAEALLSPHLR